MLTIKPQFESFEEYLGYNDNSESNRLISILWSPTTNLQITTQSAIRF
jgi:hypothetical protein